MDMMKMMKQAADLQKNMKKKQKSLAKTKVSFEHGGVRVEVTCDMKIQSIQLEDSIVERIQNLPRMLGRPLKGEPLGRYLIRIGATKLWDAFRFVKNEHSDGNMGGMGKDFFNGMKYGLTQKGENMDAREVLKIMRVWNLANHLGYSDLYPGEHDIYMAR